MDADFDFRKQTIAVGIIFPNEEDYEICMESVEDFVSIRFGKNQLKELKNLLDYVLIGEDL